MVQVMRRRKVCVLKSVAFDRSLRADAPGQFWNSVRARRGGSVEVYYPSWPDVGDAKMTKIK